MEYAIDVYASMAHTPPLKLTFIETPVFTAQVQELLSDDDYRVIDDLTASQRKQLSQIVRQLR